MKTIKYLSILAVVFGFIYLASCSKEETIQPSRGTVSWETSTTNSNERGGGKKIRITARTINGCTIPSIDQIFSDYPSFAYVITSIDTNIDVQLNVTYDYIEGGVAKSYTAPQYFSSNVLLSGNSVYADTTGTKHSFLSIGVGENFNPDDNSKITATICGTSNQATVPNYH